MIEKYSGEDDVERWIDRFQLAVEIDELSSKEAQLLSMLLCDEAYDVWKNLSADDKKDASKIKTALRKAFGLSRVNAWRELQSKRVYAGESLDTFGEQIKKLLKVSCDGKDPLEYVSGLLLMEALPVNIKENVLLQLGEDDITYSRVLTTAKKIWPSRLTCNKNSSYAAVNVQESGASACAGVDIQNRESATLTQGKGSDFQEGTSRFQRPMAPRCRGCKRFGHLQRECRVICHRCNERGHMKYDCPSAVPLNAGEGVTKSSVTPRVTK